MLTAFKTFAQDESGGTAIEYGLFAGLLAIGVSVFVSVLGGPVEEAFAKASTQVMSTVPHAGAQIVPPGPA